MYWDVRNLYGWTMSPKVSNEKKAKLELMKTSYRITMKTVTKDTKLKLMLSIQKSNASYSDLLFLFKRMNTKLVQKLVCNLYNKKTM